MPLILVGVNLTFEEAFNVAKNHFKLDLNNGSLIGTDFEKKYIPRGDDDKLIRAFLAANTNAYLESQLQKQSWKFLYVINGSGYGKTWTGKRVGLLAEKSEVQHVFVYLDFSTGNR